MCIFRAFPNYRTLSNSYKFDCKKRGNSTEKLPNGAKMNLLKQLKTNFKSMIAIILAAAIVFVLSLARVSRHLTIPNYIWVSCFSYILLLVLWGFSIADRIIEQTVRRYCLAIAFLLNFFVAVRSIKWTVEDNPLVEQFFWYMYYVPHILLPLLLFLIALSFDKKLYARYRPLIGSLFVAAGTLIIAVLTNSFHQQIFKIIEWSSSYDVIDYQPGFLMIVVWLALFFGITIVLLVRNSKLPHTNRRILLPLIVIIFYTVYAALYSVNPSPSGVGFIELMVMVCLVYISLIESLIYVGLIPSNSHYRLLFKNSSLPMMIVDDNYDVLCQTKSAIPLQKKDYWQMQDGDQRDMGDWRLCLKSLTKGYVLWSDDMHDINQQIREIEAINRELLVETELLRNEILLEKKEIALREKEHIYNEIERAIADKRQAVNQLIEHLPQQQAARRHSLMRVCLLGAYIKRTSNIVLLKQLYENMNALELENAIIESLANYRLKNKATHSGEYVDFMLSGALVQIVYQHLEDELEYYFDNDAQLVINWCEVEDTFELTWTFCATQLEPFTENSQYVEQAKKLGARFGGTVNSSSATVKYHLPRVKSS